LRILETDHTKTECDLTSPHGLINTVMLLRFDCVQYHDDIDTINTGRASHKECEGRHHREILATSFVAANAILVFSIYDVTQKIKPGKELHHVEV